MALWPDLSIYSTSDYRRFISAHLQLLGGLCQLSFEFVNNTLNRLYSSVLITTEVFEPSNFLTQVDSVTQQSKLSAPTDFARLHFLLRAVNHGNRIISAYGSNYIYNCVGCVDNFISIIAEPVKYDDNCSCEVQIACTTQAKFLDTSSSEMIPLIGLKMGCTTSESFFQSTLECFYNSTCIDLIYEYIRFGNRSNLAQIPALQFFNTSQYPVNASVATLISNLFIEDWTTTVNYSSYFQQCSPLSCSYTYIQKLDSLYTISFLLSLSGGFTIILKWICPNLVHLAVIIYNYWSQRKNSVEPTKFTLTMRTIPRCATANATMASIEEATSTTDTE